MGSFSFDQCVMSLVTLLSTYLVRFGTKFADPLWCDRPMNLVCWKLSTEAPCTSSTEEVTALCLVFSLSALASAVVYVFMNASASMSASLVRQCRAVLLY